MMPDILLLNAPFAVLASIAVATTAFGWQSAAPLLAALGIGFVIWRMRALRGTTLMAVAWWSIISLASLGLSELLIAQADGDGAGWITPLRFAAAMSTFTPGMALLGAKRPQDRGWQFIVFSLWSILSLPSLEWLAYDGLKELHPARFWFLTLLILVGLCNGLATRFWVSHLLVAAGQLALVAVHFGWGLGWLTSASGPAIGVAGLALAEWLWAMGWPTARHSRVGWDRVWLDFRDAFGVVWALRIVERVNASATMYDWPVMLNWRGFVARGNAEPNTEPNTSRQIETIPPAVIDSLRTLLRRFVGPEWIDARAGKAIAASVEEPTLTPSPSDATTTSDPTASTA